MSGSREHSTQPRATLSDGAADAPAVGSTPPGDRLRGPAAPGAVAPAVELPEAFKGYVWATPTAELAERAGLGSEQVLRFDQNTPSLPGVPRIPLGESFSRLNEYPDGVGRGTPNNPPGARAPARELVELARAHPQAIVIVDEAYVEFGAESVVPFVTETPNLVVLRTLSKAFGFASLRVGYAVAARETAALLEERRAPAPIAGPAARIAAAALREPRFDLAETVAERDRVRAALCAAGYEVPASAGNFVWIPTAEPLGERLEQQGVVVRSFPEGVRITLRRPSENDVVLRALGAHPGPRSDRTATLIRTTAETALRVTLDLDGTGSARVDTGVGFVDHLLTLLAFHGELDLDCLAGGDLAVDEHHVVEDTLATLGKALSEALGTRAGVARYGSAVVPMDESRASAAVDLVRRPHAEIVLAFRGERVGELAVSLLSHALERFAIEAGCTIHVEAEGADDHHVAEAAFKALGRALGEAVALRGDGVRSTKGAA